MFSHLEKYAINILKKFIYVMNVFKRMDVCEVIVQNVFIDF